MSYFKNIFNCMKIKIYNENNSISLSEDNQIHDNTKIEQTELLLIYSIIKKYLEFINYILDVKFSKLLWSCKINSYVIIEPLTDKEYIRLIKSLQYINNNYKHININRYNNNLLIDLYKEITEPVYGSMNIQKIITLNILMANYKINKTYINNHIELINELANELANSINAIAA